MKVNEMPLHKAAEEAEAGSQETQHAEDAPVTAIYDSDAPTSPQIRKRTRGKVGTAGESRSFAPAQHLSPTLTKLKVIELGKTFRLDELDSGQIRDREHDAKRVEFFASKYHDGAPVPPPVAIRIPGRDKPKLADGHRRCLGRKMAGFDEITVDLYDGTELDVIQIGLELNSSGPSPLKPADVVKAAVKTQVLGVRPNITRLADMAGVSRPTARKLYEREISKTGGVLDAYKAAKPRKTKEESADGIALKVLEAVEEGNDKVITAIFDKLPDDIRQQYVQALYKQHGGPVSE